VEIKVLALHGLLHLGGYDHEADEGRMARREQALRGKLGLPQGLIERAGIGDAENASGAKARGKSAGVMRGLKPSPPSGESIPSGVKARGSSVEANARAKARTVQARTVHLTSSYAGAKAHLPIRPDSARLKSCPDTRHLRIAAGGSFPSGAKAQLRSGPLSARLRSVPFKTSGKEGPTRLSASGANSRAKAIRL
jgi:hypothetical protein